MREVLKPSPRGKLSITPHPNSYKFHLPISLHASSIPKTLTRPPNDALRDAVQSRSNSILLPRLSRGPYRKIIISSGPFVIHAKPPKQDVCQLTRPEPLARRTAVLAGSYNRLSAGPAGSTHKASRLPAPCKAACRRRSRAF